MSVETCSHVSHGRHKLKKSRLQGRFRTHHRQPKLNIREPLNYKDLYGNTTDLCKIVENNSVLPIKSTYPVSSGILCHLPAFQADSERFR